MKDKQYKKFIGLVIGCFFVLLFLLLIFKIIPDIMKQPETKTIFIQDDFWGNLTFPDSNITICNQSLSIADNFNCEIDKDVGINGCVWVMNGWCMLYHTWCQGKPEAGYIDNCYEEKTNIQHITLHEIGKCPHDTTKTIIDGEEYEVC